eukprot:scaffold60435_cov69-Cyclotella_meneghiniana.AAC.4
MSATSEDDGRIELQTRYEEAMKRRELRRALKKKHSVSSEFEQATSTSTNSVDDQGETTTEEQQITSKDINSTNERLQSDRNGRVANAPKSRDWNMNDVSETDTKSFKSKDQVRPNQKSRFQVYETYFEEDYYGSDYYEDDYSQTSSPRDKLTCQWETYRSTSILFPPASKSKRPKAIIHFVGGTFFGSYPRKFYGKFLEDIAIKCDAVIVATPIPLVLPGKGLVDRLGNWLFDDSLDDDWDRRNKRRDNVAEETNNPLNHLNLAQAVQKEFNKSYRDVVIDEYCADLESEIDVEDFMKSVPIVGVGHSLGARLQAISCSHPDVAKYLAMGKGRSLIRSGREGMVYLGFANWGASTSIPGVDSLEQTVRKREMSQKQKRRDRRGVGVREDVYGDRRARPRRQDYTKRRYGQSYDRYSQYEDDDLDLADVFGDVIRDVTKGAKQIGAALTPAADDLEFKPSPDELWDSLASTRGGYKNCCQNTLIVQFDEDPIDQGSRLARTLLQVDNTIDSSEDVQPNNASHDVKFARLNGGHLTPVSFRDGIAKILPSKALAVLTSSSDYLVQQLGDETSKSSRRQREELNDVVDTVSSYIRDAI